MPRIQEPRKGHLTITIPQDIARALNWKKGNDLVFSYEDEDSVKLRKVRIRDSEKRGE
jgi:bifunctional DNA-binding transcriptional regulator/antitoxin component of YhaV-PrlF toxin-antitoxin module